MHPLENLAVILAVEFHNQAQTRQPRRPKALRAVPWNLGDGRLIKRLRQSRREPAQDFDALVHDPLARSSGLDLVLQVDENGAVFLKLVAIEVQLFNLRGVLVDDEVEAIDGLHAAS